jgi:hypothetical protein
MPFRRLMLEDPVGVTTDKTVTRRAQSSYEVAFVAPTGAVLVPDPAGGQFKRRALQAASE